MRSGGYFKVALISSFIFALLCSPIVIGTPGLGVALAAVEQPPGPESPSNGQSVNDPYESSNRKVFDFNDSVYFHVLKPVAVFYAYCLPLDFRTGLKNGFHNLVFPARVVNCLLQGKVDKAGIEIVRFVINSTTGLVGFIDIAQANFKLAGYDADFGQTLALWGVGSGPYLVIPLLGPSNERDFLGFGVDSVMDPLFWLPIDWWVSFTAQTGKFINRTSLEIGQYEDLKKASLDPYVAVRDGYMQYREHFISK
jgi:phospholipid-binding lipoprotein MlaA